MRFHSVTSLLKAALGVPLVAVCLAGEAEVLLSQPLDLSADSDCQDWVHVSYDDAPFAFGGGVPGQLFVVEDCTADPRHRDLSCVAGAPHLRFLAAAPLASTISGTIFGALVVANTRPHTLTNVQAEMLAYAAGSVARDLEWGEEQAQQEAAEAALAAEEALLQRAMSGLDGQSGKAHDTLLHGMRNAVLAIDLSLDGWPLLFANKAATLAAGLWLQQPAGVPFWQVFELATDDGGADSGWGLTASARLGAPEMARQLAAAGAPFTLSCLLRSAVLSVPASTTGSDSLVGSTLGTWLEDSAGDGGAPPLAPADAWGRFGPPVSRRRGSAEAARIPGVPPLWRGRSGCLQPGQRRSSLDMAASPYSPQLGSGGRRGSGDLASGLYAAPEAGSGGRRVSLDFGASFYAPAAPIGRRASMDVGHRAAPPADGINRRASLDSALPSLQLGAADAAAFAITFAPCTAATLGGMGVDVPQAGAAADSGGSSGVTGPLPAFWLATLRPQPALTSRALQRAHSACYTGSGQVESFLRPEEFRDVAVGPLLGMGAFGRTYRGVWQGDRVAVKIIPVREGAFGSTAPPPSQSDKPVFNGSAPLMEALLSQSLQHPHIVSTYAFGMCRNTEGHQEVWVLQELCTRGTLARAVEGGAFRDTATGAPRLRHVLATAAEIASALAFLHAKDLVHADLSGNNVLLTQSDEDSRGFVSMVGDFGLSRPLDLHSSINTGTYGTVSHMPPEMIADGRLSPAVDCYSFGVLLYEMMAGQRAWAGMSAIQILNAIGILRRSLVVPDTWPQPIQGLVKRCLSLDPKARPTAEEALAEVTQLLDALGTGHARPSP